MLKTAKVCFLCTAIIAVNQNVNAADIRLNGFASVGGGMVVDSGISRNHITGAENEATYTADAPTSGVYGEDFSFRPDTNYGLQLTANMGNGLGVTGQITGNGGEDFDAVVSWAYLSYKFNENYSVNIGRQRLPNFYYSDFIDVGYTYHWIRPPNTLVNTDGDSFEGFKFRANWPVGSWDVASEIYYGSESLSVVIETGTTTVNVHDIVGVTLKASNDWFSLRYTGRTLDVVLPDNPLSIAFQEATEDNPLGVDFHGIAANVNVGSVFAVAEWTTSLPDYNLYSFAEYSGVGDQTGWYISAGARFGSLTPHITYGEKETDYVGLPVLGPLAGGESHYTRSSNTLTVGLRWDFRPSVSFKIEYETVSDDSDAYFQDQAGGFGFGTPDEVDLISFSFDTIF